MSLIEHVRRNSEPFLAAVGFLSLLVVGLIVYGDYGVSWDEPIQRHRSGQIPLDYVARVWASGELSPYPIDYAYGPLFSLGATALERLTGLVDPHDFYRQRHLVSFGFFYVGVFGFYRLGKKLLPGRYDALIGGMCQHV
ncbi:MAG: hypothetical protein V3V08_11220 [Nannocystaceae bacterium]